MWAARREQSVANPIVSCCRCVARARKGSCIDHTLLPLSPYRTARSKRVAGSGKATWVCSSGRMNPIRSNPPGSNTPSVSTAHRIAHT
eukprot:2241252-Rhodomonas_salina.4